MPGAPRGASAWRSEFLDLSDSAKLTPKSSPAVQRLKNRSQFQAVLAGQKVTATAHFALHRCALNGAPHHLAPAPAANTPGSPLFSQGGVWIGAMVPKRWAKRAVTRNSIKRQIYNVSSAYESALSSAAHVVRLRSTFDRATFFSASSNALKQAVRKELAQLFSATVQDRTAHSPAGAA